MSFPLNLTHPTSHIRIGKGMLATWQRADAAPQAGWSKVRGGTEGKGCPEAWGLLV